MTNTNCPSCYSELTVKSVTPCFVCGAWESATDARSKQREFSEYALDDGRKIVLCTLCYLEDICSDQGDTKALLDIGDQSEVRFQRTVGLDDNLKDKYCEVCKKRLALLKLKKEKV